MRRNARLSVWGQGWFCGLIVVSLVLTGFGVSLFGVAAADATDPRGAAGQSTSPNSVSTSSHTVYLPFVAHQRADPSEVFGVQMYGSLNSPAARWDLVQTAGAAWVRWPFSWGDIEPYDTTPEHYNWAATDAAFAAAKGAGVNLIATMAGNPSWAATYYAGPLDRSGVGPFVEFFAAVVERYDGDGQNDAPGSTVINYWELYNEEDGGDRLRARYGGGYWGSFGAEYAELLCAVAPAAKAASSNAKIVLGGLAYDWFEEDGGPFVRAFLDDVLTAGGGHCLDALAFHYYPPFEAVWAPYGPGLSGKANYLRSKLGPYGHNSHPLLVTEAGYHSNDDPSWPSTDEIQASYVIKLFTQAIASHIPMMIWFSWTDLANYWAASGLLDVDRQPKLSYGALTAAQRKLGAASFQRRLSDGETGSPQVEAYRFQGSSFPLYVIWANGVDARMVRVPGKIARVSGLLDETLAKVLDADDGVADGLITLTAGFDPQSVDIIE
jgi:hypothetical protein